MISINPSDLSERENYKLLSGSIVPRPIAFVTTQSKNGVINAAPFSFFNVVTAEPPMISISVVRADNGLKDTARNIYETNEFVIHIVDESMVTDVNKTAASLPPEQSELELTSLETIESKEVSVPGIKNAKIRMECVLETSLQVGKNDLLIGRIVQFHFDEEVYENGKINSNVLNPICRLAGSNFATLGKIISVKRPK